MSFVVMAFIVANICVCARLFRPWHRSGCNFKHVLVKCL